MFEYGFCGLIQALASSVMGCVQVVLSETYGVNQETCDGAAYLCKFTFVLCNAYSIQIDIE